MRTYAEEEENIFLFSPVSLFSACDSAVDVDAATVYGGEVSNDTEGGDVQSQSHDDTEGITSQLQVILPIILVINGWK